MRIGGFRAVTVALAVLALAGCAGQNAETKKAAEAEDESGESSDLPKSATGYYAFYMTTNNLVLYGKVAKFDEDFIRLTDVHSIHANIDAKTKEVTNSLIRRGAEWHKPEETLVSTEQILFIEPVAEDSRVMALIRDLQK